MSYQGYGQQQQYGQPPPPQQGYGQHPPPGGQYPPQGNYPPQGGQYPPQGGQYPPQGGQYPPQGGQYPPPAGQYPPQQGAPPQGGYYQQQPPAGQYGAPPYGQPPPPQQQPYGAPPPPQQAYGQQPPPGQYGAPYGAPPAHQQPPQQYGPPVPPTPPSLGYGAPQVIQWDGTSDAQALRTAMKGFGTDEAMLIKVLSSKDPLQVDVIRNAFDRNFRRNLVKDIKSETSSWFEFGLVQLARGPLLADVHNLFNAMAGPGTKELVLNDVLLSRSNADIKAIKSAYRSTFHKSLEEDVKGDLSMKTERHFLMGLSANRAEDAAPVIPQQVDDDVMQIYKATEGKTGTDEILVCSIFSHRNDNQLRAIAHTYRQKFNRDLDKEFSGHMEDALLFQLNHAVDKYMHAATLLEEAMAGMGTNDNLLVSRVVRFHWDRSFLANVKGAYQQKYRTSLSSRIRSETSGDYKNLMLACVGE
ncbi:hypothetical protein RJ55_02520 [Drechmeria coniospora]|nr:hypothetical protein RJ55_02520 [Drechmeria coniospora]